MGKLVGFDIGENSVKMVYFSGRELKRAITAELPDAMVSNGRILSMDAMADFIRDMAKGHGIPLTNAAMVLNTGDHFVRSVTLPLMTEQQLRYNLPYEFRDFLTEEKNRYFFDYSMQGILNGSDGQPEKMELFACAMLKSSVEEYRAMFRRAGFRQRVLTPDESAYSALLEEHIAHHGGEDTDRCIVSLGHRSTYLYIFHGSHFDSRRGVEVGGAELDSLIADHCGVDVHVAHSYKNSDYNGVLESDYAQELYARLAGEIVRAVNFYNYNNRDRELKELYLCGGGAGIAALRETIAETTRLEVHPATDLLPEQQRPEEGSHGCTCGPLRVCLRASGEENDERAREKGDPAGPGPWPLSPQERHQYEYAGGPHPGADYAHYRRRAHLRAGRRGRQIRRNRPVPAAHGGPAGL